MSWGSRRKSKIILVALVILFFAIGSIVLKKISEQKPTCFDMKQNGTELGIDCGGGCELQCKESVLEPNNLWQRSYEITKGFYNAVAYVENQNPTAGVKQVSYSFKLFDKNRILIAERAGQTYIEPRKGLIVFEQQIPVGEKIPVYTTFEFTSPLTWYTVNPLYKDVVVETTDMVLDQKDIKPRFTATLKNTSLRTEITGMEVYVVLYDDKDTVIQVGKTAVKSLPARESKNIFFVWQKPIPVPPVRYEVITRYNPFTQEYIK